MLNLRQQSHLVIIVHHGCPLPELSGTNAIYTITYADVGIKDFFCNFTSKASFYDYFHFGNCRIIA